MAATPPQQALKSRGGRPEAEEDDFKDWKGRFNQCIPCVQFGKTHHRLMNEGSLEGYECLNTSCMIWCCFTWCFQCECIPLAMERAEIRKKYNLSGNCCCDILAASCCSCCVLAQNDKEVRYREPKEITGEVKEQYHPSTGMPRQEVSPQVSHTAQA
ncbi:hypothetical protein B0T17DRAFT_510221 [Bombardia bombarda]|uniref:Uncharacterized protein n=1 Tax=Bombardia bombarda TaxID=252184 RepID=A0AA40BVV0_9PEZI|nr:hypothetical protein B0T17DRAFT_510221 [Bombardia bombarda]